MRRLKCLQGSGGVILHDIWPVLCHHITLFSLYEFYLVKVFSSKVFNEVISTKLYASSWFFSHRGFYTWWLKAYFPLEFNVSFTHDPKALCTPYFSHRVFRRWYIERHIEDDQMDLDWSRGSVTNICIIYDQLLTDRPHMASKFWGPKFLDTIFLAIKFG